MSDAPFRNPLASTDTSVDFQGDVNRAFEKAKNASKTKLEFHVSGVFISVVYLDATMSITHGGEVEITEHPLEDGSNIADGARAKQATVQMEAVVADNPLVAPEAGEAPAGKGRAQSIYAALSKVKDSSGVIRVTTQLAAYENMLMKSLSAPQAVNMGGAVRFSLAFTQVKLVRSQTVALKRAATQKALVKVKDGAKTPTATPAAVVSKSWYKKGFSLGGAFESLSLQHGG